MAMPRISRARSAALSRSALPILVCAALLVASGGLLGQDLAARLESTDVEVRRAARAELEGRLVSAPRQLTFEGLRAGEGYYSWDGSLMVFQSEREPENPFYQIYVLDLETGDARRVSPGHGKTTCAWVHPDRKRVLYASTHADPRSKDLQRDELAFRASGQARRYAWDYDDHFDLWMTHLGDGRTERLTLEQGYDAEACISPDGQWIVFASNRHAFHEELNEADAQRFAVDRSLFLDIYKMRIDGTELTRLTDARGYDGGPFFNYDGTKICWRRFNEAGTQAEIWTMNADGSGARALTAIGAMSWAPYFHPSGEYLIFTTNRHGFANFELYLVDARSEQGSIPPVRVTWTPGFDGLPTFTPDGKQIAWTSNRTPEDRSQIFVAGWDHERARALLAMAARGEPDLAILIDERAAKVATKPEIRTEDLEARRAVWTGEALKARRLGSESAARAAEELRRQFEALGLKPAIQDRAIVSLELAGPEGQKAVALSVLAKLAAPAAAAQRAPLVLGASLDLPVTSSSRLDDDLELARTSQGLAALVEIAEWLAPRVASGEVKLERDVVFAGFAATNAGALGARDALKRMTVAGSRPAAAFIDLSRRAAPRPASPQAGEGMAEIKALLAGVASSPAWRPAIERRNVVAGVQGLALSDFALLEADTLPFHQAEVPILAWVIPQDVALAASSWFTNADQEQRMVRLLALIAQSLAVQADEPGFTAPVADAPPAPRGRIRAWLGTIPDYAEAPIPGMAISGVAPGGPGELAGLRNGDIIVRLNGEAVTSAQDYADIIEDLEVGKAAPLVYVRDGKTIETTITPRARQ